MHDKNSQYAIYKMIRQAFKIGGVLSSISLAIERTPPLRNSFTYNCLFSFVVLYLLYFCILFVVVINLEYIVCSGILK